MTRHLTPDAEAALAKAGLSRRDFVKRSGALIRRHRGVALNEGDAVERHTELFGHELRLCGEQPLPELAFPGIRRDATVSANRDP